MGRNGEGTEWVLGESGKKRSGYKERLVKKDMMCACEREREKGK